MAHTDKELMIERCDTPEDLSLKIQQLVKMIKKSKFLIVFSGAGISTSAGISDFRGPEGVWTLKSKGVVSKKRDVSTLSAFPTLSHMSLVKLQDEGIMKFLISQNCDGLHRVSGIKPNFISELHGNINIEICKKCSQKYYRDFGAKRLTTSHDHFTGRYCERVGCKYGRLLESTVDFERKLPEKELNDAMENAKKSDLCLVIGSSCTVSPACDIPKIVKKNGGNLVIVNLQKTPMTIEKYCDLHLYSKSDVVMFEVMKKLNLEIPVWKKRRRIKIKITRDGKNWELNAQGFRHDDHLVRFYCIRKIMVEMNGSNGKRIFCEKSPFIVTKKDTEIQKEIDLTIFWYYNHGEQRFKLPISIEKSNEITLDLIYDFPKKCWNFEKGINVNK